MKKRSFFAPFVLLALLFGGVWLYATPYLALRELQEAAQQGDREALNEMVDFPAFRESVKQGIRTAAAREIGGDAGPLATLGGMLAGALASPLADAFVTPEGIAALTRGSLPDDADGDGGERNRRVRGPDVKVSRGYEDFDQFVVRFADKESGDERVSLVLTREGIARWKLTGVRLPDERRN